MGEAEMEAQQSEFAERVRLQKAKELLEAAKKKDKRMRRKKNQKNRSTVKHKEADKNPTGSTTNDADTPTESAPLIVTRTQNTEDIEEEELELKPIKGTKTKI